MLRLTKVSAAGFKQKDLDIKLEPVALIVGKNGSGKSAILESISYALSGHVSGVKTTEIGLLLPDPKTVSVVVEAEDQVAKKTLTVSRGIQSKKRYARGRAWLDDKAASDEANDAAGFARFVDEHFGPRAELFLEAFDPEKNIWSLSAEARLSWTFGIVARASGWDKARLKKVFDDIGYGNIDQGKDVVECLDINIKSAGEWARNTAKSVREYEAILAGLTDAISEPKPEEIEAAKKTVKDLRDQFSKSEAAIRRADLALKVAAAEEDVELRAEATRELEKLRAERAEVVRANEEDKKDADQAEVKRRALMRHHQDVATALQAIEESGVCPTCGAAYAGDALNALSSLWLSEQRTREAEIERLGAVVHAYDRGGAYRQDDGHKFVKDERALLEKGAGRVAEAEKTLEALKNKLALVEDDGLEEPAKIRALLEEAESKLEDITNRQQLAVERGKKTADRDKAQAAAAMWKKRHEALQDARGRILGDARSAVAGALDHEIDDMVAPHGGKWRIDISDETGMDVAYAFPDGSFVRYKAMSSGERIVATVVLLVALRRLLGDVPWSALLVDNLELVSHKERVQLVHYVSTLSGLFSNIILLSSDTRPVGTVAPIVCE